MSYIVGSKTSDRNWLNYWKPVFMRCSIKNIIGMSWLNPFVLAVVITALYVATACAQNPVTKKSNGDDKNPIDGDSAYSILKQICDLGPRISGSRAMQNQQTMLTEYFEKLGATVHLQTFRMQHPATAEDTEIGNLIVEFYPDREKRVMICTHYDTRPFPDRDPTNPRGLFLGANDGASGVGLLCELGRHVTKLDGDVGLDFVFFDAEEFIYDRNRDELFVGSTHFATEYRDNPPKHKYEAAVLIDMIGDKHLDLFYEKNSLKYAPRVTKEIWQVAGDLDISEFKARARHEVRDDHLPLNNIAQIPTCDIIDFDYPTIRNRNIYWHTTDDTVDKCSAESLAKVGWVLHVWIKKRITKSNK